MKGSMQQEHNQNIYIHGNFTYCDDVEKLILIKFIWMFLSISKKSTKFINISLAFLIISTYRDFSKWYYAPLACSPSNDNGYILCVWGVGLGFTFTNIKVEYHSNENPLTNSEK